MDNLLTLVQERVADRLGVPRPTSLIGNTDNDARLFLSLATEVCEDLAKLDWQIQMRFATFQSVAAQLQYDLTTIASDYDRLEGETMWNLSQAVFINGPLTPQEWETQVARNALGPYSRFQIRVDPDTNKNAIFLNPAPLAAMTFGFAYFSKGFSLPVVQATPALPPQTIWNLDTDVPLFEDRLVAQGIRAYWKREKQLSGWPDDMDTYDRTVETLLSQQRATRIADMVPNPSITYVGPGNIPEGDWNQ